MDRSAKKTTKILSKNLFPVVGVGASAGGLEAFIKLIKAIPASSGIAFILVQHLHPEYISSLPEILQRETKIPVQEVKDNVKVKPDIIYIIPPNKIMVATDGILKLSPRPKDHKNMPIDVFFSSLAEVHQNNAIGIVLSGTGADGTAGLKKIKDQGGITFAQEIGSAVYDDMPQNAINSDVVDFILPPEEMPKQLLKVIATFNKFNADGNPLEKEDTEEESFRQILSVIRTRYVADFTYYKQTTIHRRILRRVAIVKLDKIGDYLKFLKQNKGEQDILLQDLLIPVTSFFRDPKTFGNITETIFPEIIKNKSSVSPVRIWIAGCSTGEEAYSMGMSLHEYLSEIISTVKIQIFATDISHLSIAKARSGVYSKRQLEGVSDVRLQQFFTKIDGHYQIKKVIRDMCVFAAHNFLKDPPFAKVDLISCRNVLIYMEPFLQKKVFSIFHYALNEKGYLVLGKSETTGSSSELFVTVGKKDKIYISKSLPEKFMNVTSLRSEELIKDTDYATGNNERKKDDYQKNADDILLSKYTPAGVIVNEQYDIVQFRGSTGAYLEPSPGKATLNVLRMAREGLSFELRNALHKAKAAGKPFSKGGIPLNYGNILVTVEVIPLLNAIDLHFLILFKDTLKSEELNTLQKKQSKTVVKKQENSRIKDLEKDLEMAREDMRSITEEQEASNEELQSANEELLSGSEELQSLNEELETSKEELQSINEELITVNQELFDRNEQLNQSRIYTEGIITTIHEPLVVLTADFRIKSANNAFYKTFAITEKETLGNNLFQLHNNGWDIPGIKKQLSNLLQKKETFLEWEVTYTFPSIGERTICFNAQPITEESGRHLILLALDDITLRKEAEKIHYLQSVRLILESIPQIAFSAAADGTFIYFNNFFLDYAGINLKKALESEWLYGIEPSDEDEVQKAWKQSIKTLENFTAEFRLKRKSDGMYRWHVCRATALVNDEGIVTSWVGAASDIDEQKKKEFAKDEFINVTSNELKTPLTSAKAFVQLLEFSLKEKKDTDVIYAKKASVAINKVNDLIVELMDVNKRQYGKRNLTITSFNFNEMILEAIEGVRALSKKHTIVFTAEIQSRINGDKEKLQQVMINLLTNAIQYSPGSDKVFLHAIQEGNILKVSIKDAGLGVNKKNLNKIFERYYREERRGDHFPGLGIGLSISKEIINSHNGKIWVDSEPRKGSTFYFTIPVESYNGNG
jgi:two-component system CheB/CheR fusion protein